MNYFEQVYQLVKQIPRGKVTTYGEIALALGNPRQSRQVGWALHQNPYEGEVPCHRVVNRFGDLAPAFAFGGSDAQRQRLRSENVEVIDYRVDLDKYGYKF